MLKEVVRGLPIGVQKVLFSPFWGGILLNYLVRLTGKKENLSSMMLCPGRHWNKHS